MQTVHYFQQQKKSKNEIFFSKKLPMRECEVRYVLDMSVELFKIPELIKHEMAALFKSLQRSVSYKPPARFSCHSAMSTYATLIIVFILTSTLIPSVWKVWIGGFCLGMKL